MQPITASKADPREIVAEGDTRQKKRCNKRGEGHGGGRERTADAESAIENCQQQKHDRRDSNFEVDSQTAKASSAKDG
jgi:hypothetical protein